MKRTGHLVSWCLLALAVIIQLVVLYDPSPGTPGSLARFDKVVHFGIFAFPALVLAVHPGLSGPRRDLAVLLFAVHAPISEVIQMTLLPGRSADPADAAADLCGVAAGVLVGTLVRGRVLGRRRRLRVGR